MIGRPIVRRPSSLRPELVVMALVARALGQVLACLAHRDARRLADRGCRRSSRGVVRVTGLGAVAERGDGGGSAWMLKVRGWVAGIGLA